MKTRVAAGSTTPYVTLVSSGLLVTGFAYMFLTGRAVTHMTGLYQALRLEALLPLDQMFTLGHLAIYAALTLILCRSGKKVRDWMTVAVWLGIIGIAVEVVQEMVGARSFGLGDIAANCLGITLALAWRCLSRTRA